MQRLVALCLLASLPTCISCGSAGPERLATYPVTGEVYIDGKPGGDVGVALHRVGGVDSNHPTVTTTRTEENGKFSLSTYEAGDGAPEGDYVVTFAWDELDKLSMAYSNDKLKGKYSDPDKSEHKVKVAGAAVDLGRIELSTK